MLRAVKRIVFLITGLLFATCGLAQVSAGKGSPVPKHDISGIWRPVGSGVQPLGARDMPADGKHEPPYSAVGLEAFKRNKPSNGPTEVAPGEENDPGHACDPLGFPRANLFELRATEVLQTPSHVSILYTYNKVWRTVWTDGRELPKDPDPRWYGYSVGKWTDDYTFVVRTNGLDERTWLDNAGRPHSDELEVEEVYRRLDQGTIELTLTINDPKYYTNPWVAIDKMKLTLQPPTFETPEMICSPSELAEYNKKHGALGSRPAK